MDIDWSYEDSTSSPFTFPWFLFLPLLLPLRDLLLVEARVWLIFSAFVSGFDSETSGSMCVQCPGSSLLTVWFSCCLLLGFRVTLLMLRLPRPYSRNEGCQWSSLFVLLFLAHDFSSMFETRMSFLCFLLSSLPLWNFGKHQGK